MATVASSNRGSPEGGEAVESPEQGNPAPASQTRASDSRGHVRFGNYDLILMLGHGGMADVFLAVYSRHASVGFNKLTVIKRLRENLIGDPEFIEMLVDEARLAARLNHPNIVQTNEIGVVGKQYFIEMEYLDGQPLHRIILRAARAAAGQSTGVGIRRTVGGIPLNLALTILCDVLAGLQYAHELANYDGTALNIVHRDVSPQNVMVTYDGQVKLVDFGIAKAVGRSAETRVGVVKGKIAYMAPEQPVGGVVDGRADIFAVGIVLWELLTGKRMWDGVEELSIYHRLMSKDITGSPKTVDPSIPDEIDRICQRALAPEPEDRYPTAADFQNDLERYLRRENAYASAREVREFVCSLFVDKRTQTRQVIDARLNELRERGNAPAIRSTKPPPPNDAIRELEQPNAITAELALGPPPRKSSLPRVLGITLAMILLGVGALLALRPSLFLGGLGGNFLGTPTPSPSPASGAGARAGTGFSELVHLEVRATPSDAKLYLDSATLSNPTLQSYPRDGVAHTIRAEAPGYVPATRIVRFDSPEQKVELALISVNGRH
jgi:serine/threonine protein kinase